jgi:predicted HicB family RNase H-like nuclease
MRHLPETDSISELAAFWQTHDLMDFEDELEEVVEPVFMRKKQLTLRLSPADAAALHVSASKQRISEVDLVSRWVHEHLQAEQEPPTSAST